jgi:TPR repeat protein
MSSIQQEHGMHARIDRCLGALLLAATVGIHGCGDDCGGSDAAKCLAQGVILQNGGPEQVRNALELFDKVCTGQSASRLQGCTLAGHLYRDGKGGLPAEGPRALAYYRLACDLGAAAKLAPACFSLGNAYGLGRHGVKTDAEQSKRYLEEACRLGNADACRFAKMLAGSTGENALAMVLARCDKGAAPACTDAGHRLWKGIKGAERDVRKGMGYFEKACELSDGSGCLAAAVLLKKGELNGRPDLAAAASFMQRSCDTGNALGCRELGKAYILGQGVRRDLRRGRGLMRRACNGGERSACRFAS